MIDATTYAGKRLLAKLKYEVDYDRLVTYAEMIRLIEIEVEERIHQDLRDAEAEEKFLQPINPDPVTNFAKTLPRKGKA